MAPEITKKIEEYFSQYPVRSYPKGQILIHAGDVSKDIYYLESGKVRQYDISYRGDEIVVNIFKTHNFFPMLSATIQKTNNYFFAAETPVDIRIAPSKKVVEFLKANPDVMFDLLTRVYRGVDGLLGRVVQLMSGSARSRLLYELIIECKRFGKAAEDGSYLLKINEGDLAARAGLSRETISREIHKISQGNLINVSHSGILIKSLPRLEKKFNSEA